MNSNFDTIYNEFNGSISAVNLATDAVTTAKIADQNVTSAKIADSNVGNTQLAVGVAVQQVSTLSSAATTVSGAGGIIPNDDTIPQNTEGGEVMTVTITPKSATNILVIESVVFQSNGNATQVMTQALFQDSTANALAATSCFSGASTIVPFAYPLKHTMVAGTTSATTFKIRIGSHQNTTNTFNGVSGGRMFGAIPKSSLVVTEYKAS